MEKQKLGVMRGWNYQRRRSRTYIKEASFEEQLKIWSHTRERKMCRAAVCRKRTSKQTVEDRKKINMYNTTLDKTSLKTTNLIRSSTRSKVGACTKKHVALMFKRGSDLGNITLVNLKGGILCHLTKPIKSIAKD